VGHFKQLSLTVGADGFALPDRAALVFRRLKLATLRGLDRIGMICLAIIVSELNFTVPELTCRAAVKLNNRVSLRLHTPPPYASVP
jgi:hypothetical protein